MIRHLTRRLSVRHTPHGFEFTQDEAGGLACGLGLFVRATCGEGNPLSGAIPVTEWSVPLSLILGVLRVCRLCNQDEWQDTSRGLQEEEDSRTIIWPEFHNLCQPCSISSFLCSRDTHLQKTVHRGKRDAIGRYPPTT